MEQKAKVGNYYLQEFINAVKELTAHYANYKQMHLTIEKQSENEKSDLRKLQTDPQFMAIITNVRYYLTNAHVLYTAVHSQLGAEYEGNKEINALMDKLEAQYMFKIDDLKSFVYKLNMFVASKAITNALETTGDLVNKLYPNA